jgi:hypothetical protein
MIGRGVILAAAMSCGAILLLTGCGSSGGGGAVPNSSAAASAPVQVPTGFDPCNDIPQSALDPEGLQGKDVDNYQADAGKVLWRGCVWADPDGYGARIQTTNITVDQVRGKNFPGTQEFSIDGRRAIASQQVDDHPSEACTVDVAMKGGSLEFNLTNPASAPKTGKTDTCQLARELAEKVVPAMPASA